jgi:hypothetical protein
MFLLVFGQTAAIRRAQMELEELALPSGSRRE